MVFLIVYRRIKYFSQYILLPSAVTQGFFRYLIYVAAVASGWLAFGEELSVFFFSGIFFLISDAFFICITFLTTLIITGAPMPKRCALVNASDKP
jgi:hypothetical protein